jgi:iron(III) transport system substrate-binding protein
MHHIDKISLTYQTATRILARTQKSSDQFPKEDAMYLRLCMSRWLIPRGFVSTLLLAIICFLQAPAAVAADAAQLKLIEAAKKEGKVVFYSSWSQKAAVELVDLFQKKYPFIKTELTRVGADQMLNKVIVEDDAKKRLFDVVSTKGDIIDVFKRRNILAKYDSPERKYYDALFKDKEGYWTDTYPTIHSVAYNTNLVKPNEAPVKYRDLLNPKWKGMIGINLVNFMWGEVIMQTMGQAEGLKFLEKLAEQSPAAREGSTLNVTMLAAGEIAIAASVNINTVEEYKAKKAPMEWAKMDEPFYADLHPISLSAHAVHPNAAKLLTDFILSEEGQKILIDEGKTPARRGLKTKYPIPEKYKILDPALSERTEYQFKLMNKLFVK